MAKFFIPSQEPKKERVPFDPKALIDELEEWVNAQETWHLIPMRDSLSQVLLIREVPIVVARWVNKTPHGREHIEESFQEVVLVMAASLDDLVNKKDIANSCLWTKRAIITDNMESIKKHLMILEENNS